MVLHEARKPVGLVFGSEATYVAVQASPSSTSALNYSNLSAVMWEGSGSWDADEEHAVPQSVTYEDAIQNVELMPPRSREREEAPVQLTFFPRTKSDINEDEVCGCADACGGDGRRDGRSAIDDLTEAMDGCF